MRVHSFSGSIAPTPVHEAGRHQKSGHQLAVRGTTAALPVFRRGITNENARQLRVVKLTDYTAEKVRTLCASPDELCARWADAVQRADIIQQLAERGIDFATVAAQVGQPEADPFELLCHLAFNTPVLTRRKRADRLKQQHVAFFKFFAPEAREILDDLLEKYASDGELQLVAVRKRGEVLPASKRSIGCRFGHWQFSLGWCIDFAGWKGFVVKAGI